MKNLLRASAFVVLGLAAFTPGVRAADVTATVTANIISAIGIGKTADMSFANLLSAAAAADVTLSPTSTITTSLAHSGTPAAAAFTITGEVGQSYQVTLPTAAVQLAAGANTMNVDTFSSSLPALTGTIPAGGSVSFTVGAVLHVGASQPDGDYTGQFTVAVVYD